MYLLRSKGTLAMETTKQFLMQCISCTRKKNLLVALDVKNEREREREIYIIPCKHVEAAKKVKAYQEDLVKTP
jgi:hypothetical protein